MSEFEKITNCILSFDPAQLADYSAIAIIDRVDTHLKPDFDQEIVTKTRYRVLKLERLPMGVTYPNQIRHILRTWQALEAKYRSVQKRPSLLIDCGCVGLSDYDTLRESARDQHINVPIYGMRFTGGFYPSDHGSKSITNVPKAEVFAGLTVAMQSGMIEINPSLKYAPVLREEALNFNTELTENGHRTMEAAPGFHDDLLCAVAMGIYKMANKRQTPRVLRNPFRG